MKITKLLIGLSLLITGFGVFAQVDKTVQDNIIRTVKENFTKYKKINTITPIAIPGMYEVVLDDVYILYLDSTGRYGFNGNFMDIKNKKSITGDKLKQLTFINYNNLDFNNSFKIVKGDGSRSFAIFLDPNCMYCKNMTREIEGLTNYTANVFLLPVLGNDSMKKSQSIWCSENKEKVFKDWMLYAKPIPEQSCSSGAISNNINFAQKHRIFKTPTIIFSDGSKTTGFYNANIIEKRLLAKPLASFAPTSNSYTNQIINNK